MEYKKKVTISHVAREAKVAVGTVSHYINGTASVSEEKAKRIAEAVEKLKYSPNTFAGSLRRKNSNMVYILTPHLDNSFYTSIISVFMRLADVDGYIVNISSYEYSLEKEKKYLDSILSSKPGTIVIIFNGNNDDKEIERLIERGIKVILADRASKISNVSTVSYENHKIMKDIIDFLMSRGYEKIGLFMETPVLTNLKERYDAYIEWMQSYGVKNLEGNIFSKPELSLDKVKSGYLYMKEILESVPIEKLPRGWITSSDILAIGMIRAFNEAGYQVPKDFGVVGFDNIQISGYVMPRLTTAMQNQECFAEELWKVTKAVGKGEEEIHIVIPQELIVRESC